MDTVVYVHGKGGRAADAARYEPLFPAHKVVGLDYRTFTPWETGPEIADAVRSFRAEGGRILLIADSIGAYFAMHAGIGDEIAHAWFVSPIVDMEALILGMMAQTGVTKDELKKKRTIPTAFGEDLSWDYLTWVQSHPVRWTAPTDVLYGGRDNLTSRETITAFAETHHAALTVMEDGEHWFHTGEQLRFLDDWIRRTRSSSAKEDTP